MCTVLVVEALHECHQARELCRAAGVGGDGGIGQSLQRLVYRLQLDVQSFVPLRGRRLVRGTNRLTLRTGAAFERRGGRLECCRLLLQQAVPQFTGQLLQGRPLGLGGLARRVQAGFELCALEYCGVLPGASLGQFGLHPHTLGVAMGRGGLGAVLEHSDGDDAHHGDEHRG